MSEGARIFEGGLDMRRRCLLFLLLTVGASILPGCASSKRRALQKRQRLAEVEIIEMYRDCLRRKQGDATVDCSEYRATIRRIRAPKK